MLVRQLALDLTTNAFGTDRGLANKDFRGETRRIFDWVRANIRYVKDIDGVETLHHADWLLKIGAGDCDDFAILLASLLLSIGHTPRFIAVAFEPDSFSHVWVQDQINGGWLDLEATEDIPFGTSVPLRDAVRIITMDA